MELEGLDKQRIGFITFRAHVSQPQVFEDFLSVFLPHISSNFSIYTYSIEKDNSPDRHLHMAVAVDEKIYDTQKLKQKIEAKWLRDFNKRLSLGPTDIKHAYVLKFNEDPDDEKKKIKMNQLEHKMKVIGYIHKEINRRTEIRGLSQSLITACCDFYFANRRMENKVDNDWKIINSKNFHVSCEQFAKENDMTVYDYSLIAKMTHQRHTFQISAKDQEKYIAELRFANKKYNEQNNEFRAINKFQDNFKQDEENAYIVYLQTLLKRAGKEYLGFYDNWYNSPTEHDMKTKYK